MDRAGEGAWLLLLVGALAVAAGGVAIVVPAVGSVGMDLLIGWLLVFATGFLAIDAFSAIEFKRTAFRLLLAVVTFAAGVYLLAAPLEGTYTLTVMLVIWFVAMGFTRIAIGLAEWGTAPGAGFVAFSGLISLLLGILIANDLPDAADWAIGLLVGIDLVFYGCASIASWWELRRASHADAGSAPRPA